MRPLEAPVDPHISARLRSAGLHQLTASVRWLLVDSQETKLVCTLKPMVVIVSGDHLKCRAWQLIGRRRWPPQRQSQEFILNSSCKFMQSSVVDPKLSPLSYFGLVWPMGVHAKQTETTTGS